MLSTSDSLTTPLVQEENQLSGALNSISSSDEEYDDFDPNSLLVQSFISTKGTESSPVYDLPGEMTYGRRIALKLMKYKWYFNPEKVKRNQELKRAQHAPRRFSWEDEEGKAMKSREEEKEQLPGDATKNEVGHTPCLKEAWKYFEHFTLPRYVVSSSSRDTIPTVSGPRRRRASQLDRAASGESLMRTKLYSPCFTPLSQMGDFGLGMGLYFSTLRALTIIMLLAGLMNIPNMVYYSSSEYSKNGQGDINTLKGSAICADQTYVVCNDCNFEQFNHGAENRLATTDKSSTISLTFALKTNCLGAQIQQGMVSFATLLFILVAFFFVDMNQKKWEVKFDEDEQTAQDYSIVVTNPPKNAYDPDEWKRFFSNFDGASVACCTVKVANGVLLQALTARREGLRELELQFPVGESTDMNHVARIAAEMDANQSTWSKFLSCFHGFGLFLDIPALYAKVVVETARVRGLAQRQYPVTQVLVTFETEGAQRQVRSVLSYGKYQIWKKDHKMVEDKYLFRGKYLLEVKEAAEPSSIRWHYQDATFKVLVRRLFLTTLISLVVTALAASIVWFLFDVDVRLAAYAIAVMNAIFPTFAGFLTATEPHRSEDQKERSLFAKIALFRCVNSVIVVSFTTPFTSTITAGEDGLLYAILRIFVAEIVTRNLLQYLDIFGQIDRHIFAPRLPDQERMNLKFRGTPYDLAERYSSVIKILFLCFYCCAIYPTAFFFSSFSFLLSYYMDKFSLMRSWAKAPRIGKQIGDFTRKYVLSFLVFALAYIASYAWAGFPYDNLCESKDSVGFNGTFTAYKEGIERSENRITVHVSERDPVYKFCNQNLHLVSFPALPTSQSPGNEWMTEEQTWVTNIYGWTSIAFLGLLLLLFSWRISKKILYTLFGHYKVIGMDMGINYNDVPVIDAYVPQIWTNLYAHPLLACNVDLIDKRLIGWQDPERPYDYYNLTKDAEKIFEGTSYSCSARAFSTIKWWPPRER